jgi:hypothetical protein
MALQISKKELEKVYSGAKRMLSRAEGLKEKSEATIEGITRAMVVAGTSFGFGLVNGRYGAITPLGVPVDLGVGIGAHLLGFTGLAGKMTPQAHAIGDGALSAYAYTVGRGTGKVWRKKAGLPLIEGSNDNRRQITEQGGGGLSDEKLAELLNRA